jgi:hypothetical protein
MVKALAMANEGLAAVTLNNSTRSPVSSMIPDIT